MCGSKRGATGESVAERIRCKGRKMWPTYTMEYYSALKRKEILTCATNMDEP